MNSPCGKLLAAAATTTVRISVGVIDIDIVIVAVGRNSEMWLLRSGGTCSREEVDFACSCRWACACVKEMA